MKNIYPPVASESMIVKDGKKLMGTVKMGEI